MTKLMFMCGSKETLSRNLSLREASLKVEVMVSQSSTKCKGAVQSPRISMSLTALSFVLPLAADADGDCCVTPKQSPTLACCLRL